MGITKLFSKNGNMSGISDQRITIDLVMAPSCVLVPRSCLALLLPLSPISWWACHPNFKDTGAWVAILAPKPLSLWTWSIECSSSV